MNEVKSYVTQYERENVYIITRIKVDFSYKCIIGEHWQLKVHSKSNVLSNLFFLQLTSILSNPRFSYGKFLSPLYLVLEEPSGKFGPIVQETIFQPINVFVVAPKSGKLIS